MASPSGPVATGWCPMLAVAVFFATGPENLYQFEQWRLPLEHLAAAASGLRDRRPGRTPATECWQAQPAARVLAGQRRARGAGRLSGTSGSCSTSISSRRTSACCGSRARCTFRLGTARATRAGSISNQHKAYDLVFVGGDAGRDRLDQRAARIRCRPSAHWRSAVRSLTTATRAPRPGPATPALRVWYAPTWEGDRPSIAYGSLASHGVAIIEALLADPSIRVIYRPHARTGYASREHRDADKTVRALLAKAGDRHLVDRDSYGWQWDFADACITDISAVAYDWLATGKPLVITEPAPSAYRPASPLLDAPAAAGCRGGRRGGVQNPRTARRSGGEGATPGSRVPLFRRCECSAEHEAVRGCNRARLPAPTILIGLRGLRARAGNQCRRRVPSGAASGFVPDDSALGRPSSSQQTAPASGRQMIAVAQSQRGIRRTAYGGA